MAHVLCPFEEWMLLQWGMRFAYTTLQSGKVRGETRRVDKRQRIHQNSTDKTTAYHQILPTVFALLNCPLNAQVLLITDR